MNGSKSRIVYGTRYRSDCVRLSGYPAAGALVSRCVNVTVGDGIPVDVGSTARSVNLAQKLSRNYLLEESMTLARVTPGHAIVCEEESPFAFVVLWSGIENFTLATRAFYSK